MQKAETQDYIKKLVKLRSMNIINKSGGKTVDS